MGASLVLSAVRWPSALENKSVFSDWPDPMQESDVAELLHKNSASLSDDDLRTVASSMESFDAVEDCGFDWDEHPLKDEHRLWAIDVVRQAIDELIPLGRDNQLLLLDNHWWLMVGGTSYGDGFEEEWNAMDVLVSAGLLSR